MSMCKAVNETAPKRRRLNRDYTHPDIASLRGSLYTIRRSQVPTIYHGALGWSLDVRSQFEALLLLFSHPRCGPVHVCEAGVNCQLAVRLVWEFACEDVVAFDLREDLAIILRGANLWGEGFVVEGPLLGLSVVNLSITGREPGKPDLQSAITIAPQPQDLFMPQEIAFAHFPGCELFCEEHNDCGFFLQHKGTTDEESFGQFPANMVILIIFFYSARRIDDVAAHYPLYCTNPALELCTLYGALSSL
ncbi:hypothetical protein Pelo_7616 [Pelomyxa schiedti]|nr:hypothetical protein Pelo_7616 [Pelomyxa schiedti]